VKCVPGGYAVGDTKTPEEFRINTHSSLAFEVFYPLTRKELYVSCGLLSSRQQTIDQRRLALRCYTCDEMLRCGGVNKDTVVTFI